MPQALTPGLVVAHSHRLEDLTEVAVNLMQSYPLTPLEEETILVQSNGIAQWLKISLARSSGIAAMLSVTLPARFVWKAYRTILGDDIPKTSPFDKDRLSWRIMRVLPNLVEADSSGEFIALKNYLGDIRKDDRKLFQLSARIADLFDQYQNYRADWLDHWSDGRFVLDGEHAPVPPNEVWQPILWRALVDDIGQELFWTNRAKLHRQFIRKAKSLGSQKPHGMPSRLVIFGISSLPQQTLEVLDAIKGFTQIVLCVHNPCKHYWANIVDGKEALKHVLKESKRRHELRDGMAEDISEEELHHHAHPLLASWGKQGRDYIHLLDLYDETLEKQEAFDALKFEIFDEDATPSNMLQQLQSDVLNLRPVHESQNFWQPATGQDASISFHICHSEQREVEALQDQLLDAFANNSNLKPRDIMVMVPDMDTYAPHIEAVFGRISHQDERYIPYTIADQGQRHQQPLLVALEMLLTLDQSRVTQSDILSLLDVPSVQHRFEISSQNLQDIQGWLERAGARWGLNGDHRAQFGMPVDDETNSWWFGLERMVFGYAMGRPDSVNQERWQDIEPYHEIAGLGADAAGKLALIIEALNGWWMLCRSGELKSPHQWAELSEALLDMFFSTEEDQDRLLISQLSVELAELRMQVGEAQFENDVSLSTFRESWLQRIDQPNLNQRFLAGSINFATLMPMRAIPFQHIYVLGMSEGAFPRQRATVDFDLMSDHYRPGDRSRRDDDRYLFLEALLSARQKFSVSWVGRSAQDNSEWPPSVLVAQLREHVSAVWCPKDLNKAEFLNSLTTEHYLQAFNRDYLLQRHNEQGNSKYFTYAHEWLAAHSAKEKQVSSPKPWQPEQNETLRVNANELDRFLREPARPFFNRRLNTYFSHEEFETQDSEDFKLNSLSKWSMKNELSDVCIQYFRTLVKNGSEVGEEAFKGVENALLPHLQQLARAGYFGVKTLNESMIGEVLNELEPLTEKLAAMIIEYSQPLDDIHATFASNGVSFEDVCSGLFQNEHGEVLQLLVTPSKKSLKSHFLPYLKHILLTVNAAQRKLGRVRTVLICTDEKNKERSAAIEFEPIGSTLARDLLEYVLVFYRGVMDAPPPASGELLLQWSKTYLQALSGSKPRKDGSQNQEPLSPEQANSVTTEEILKTLQRSGKSISELYAYSGRVSDDFNETLQHTQFNQWLKEIYIPIARASLGKLPLADMETSLFEEGQS